MVSYLTSGADNSIKKHVHVKVAFMDRLFTRCCWTACLLAVACVAEAFNLFTNVHPKLCFSLRSDTLNDFRTHGHAVTRNLLSRSAFDAVAGKLWQLAAEQHGMEGVTQGSLGERSMGKLRRVSQFDRIVDPHARHPSVADLALSPLFLGTAAALLGVAQVRLFGDTLFWKRKGHGPTAWHADLWTAPLATDRFITVWLPLGCTSQEDAPLYFQSGTHRHPSVTIQCLPQGKADVGPPGRAGTHHAPLEVGDATWHHGWTMHGSPSLSGSGVDGPGRLAYTASYYCDNDGGLTPLDAELSTNFLR